MSDIFSHASEPDYVEAKEIGNRRSESLVIGTTVVHAFDGFTDAVHLWWPVGTESSFGEGSHVAFLRDHLVEESEDGEEVIWADIVDWQSPTRIQLEWTLGQESHAPLDVEIRFDPETDSSCRVTIAFDQIQDVQSISGFDCDWPLILARFARFMGGTLSLD